MKIKCNYCSASFDDYLAECPYCGAPNEGVVRTVSDQPLTIEQLQDWYKSKGLPPYETTRFFIGIDYKQPRAFGIYKEPDTGKVVVYKNKDNGERAIRYQGTDEAYGVNELFQRLKQEIIQQKMNNVRKKSDGSASDGHLTAGEAASAVGDVASGIGHVIGKILIQVIAIIGGAIGLIIVIGTVLLAFTPSDGYYSYNDNYYYYDDSGYDDLYVFKYDKKTEDWDNPVGKEDDPGIFTKKSKCKKYFLSEDYDPSYGCTDIYDSLVYKDYIASRNISTGYYAVNDEYYYHQGYNYESDWYYYDNDDWNAISVTDLPADLSHASSVDDFYYTPTWDSSTQITDFTETDEYTSNYESGSNDDDSSYSWDSSDSWDSGGSDWSSDW